MTTTNEIGACAICDMRMEGVALLPEICFRCWGRKTCVAAPADLVAALDDFPIVFRARKRTTGAAPTRERRAKFET